jgi:hypothetical protein
MPTKTLMTSTLGVVLGEANWMRRCISAAMEKRGELNGAFSPNRQHAREQFEGAFTARERERLRSD